MPALSPRKNEVWGQGAAEWVQKKTRLQKREDLYMGVLRKKLKHTVILKYFFS
jgi:hypothetical protein